MQQHPPTYHAQPIGIGRLFRVARRWWPVVVIPALAGALFGVYSSMASPYSSVALLKVNSANPAGQTDTLAAQTALRILQSDDVFTRAREVLGPTATGLQARTDLSKVTDTNLISITVSAPTAPQAEREVGTLTTTGLDVIQALAQQSVDSTNRAGRLALGSGVLDNGAAELARLQQLGSVTAERQDAATTSSLLLTRVGEPQAAYQTGPSKTTSGLIGLLLGLLVGLGAALVFGRRFGVVRRATDAAEALPGAEIFDAHGLTRVATRLAARPHAPLVGVLALRGASADLSKMTELLQEELKAEARTPYVLRTGGVIEAALRTSSGERAQRDGSTITDVSSLPPVPEPQAPRRPRLLARGKGSGSATAVVDAPEGAEKGTEKVTERAPEQAADATAPEATASTAPEPSTARATEPGEGGAPASSAPTEAPKWRPSPRPRRPQPGPNGATTLVDDRPSAKVVLLKPGNGPAPARSQGATHGATALAPDTHADTYPDTDAENASRATASGGPVAEQAGDTVSATGPAATNGAVNGAPSTDGTASTAGTASTNGAAATGTPATNGTAVTGTRGATASTGTTGATASTTGTASTGGTAPTTGTTPTTGTAATNGSAPALREDAEITDPRSDAEAFEDAPSFGRNRDRDLAAVGCDVLMVSGAHTADVAARLSGRAETVVLLAKRGATCLRDLIRAGKDLEDTPIVVVLT